MPAQSWPPQLEGFAKYLGELRGRSALTIAAYCRDVYAFELWCRAQGHDPLASLGSARVSLYVMSRTAEQKRKDGAQARLSARSASRALSAIGAWARYLVFSGALEGSALAKLRSPKYARKLPSYFKVEEMLMLVRAWDGDTSPLGRRNRAILYLLYSAGLRVAECAGLRLGSVDHGAGMLRVMGKGGRERFVPFGGQAGQALNDYLELARPQLSGAASADWLWLSRRSGRLGIRAIQRIVDAASLRAGLLKPVSPHKLRHACATHMLEGGADVRLLQELLGHRDLNTTQVYTQITRKHLLEAYEKTHPRA